MSRIYLNALLLGTALFLGCKKSFSESEVAIRPTLSDDFKGFGSPTNGARLADITAEFGDPVSSQIYDGTNYLNFAIDPGPQVPKGLVGVTLLEKNGVVSFVRPITGDAIPFNKAQRTAAKNIMMREIMLQIGESVLTIRPKAGAPSQMNEASQKPFVLRAVVDLADEDAVALEKLTSTNVGKMVRLYLGKDFVSEFLITQEIRTNMIEIRFKDPGVPIESLYERRPVEGNNPPKPK